MARADTIAASGDFARNTAPPRAVARGASIAIDPHAADATRAREKFLPLTRAALLDRLSRPENWPAGEAREVRRFMRYLDYWRRHSYTAQLIELEQAYEPFAPDSDLKSTRSYSDADRAALQARVVAGMSALLEQGNFTRVRSDDVHLIMTDDSHYGLDLHVDLHAFEEALIYYRGATTRTEERRNPRRLWLAKKKVEVPIFQRLFLLFKLKPFDVRVAEVMAQQKVSQRKAEKLVRKARSLLPKSVTSERIYMKLFKDMPRTDVEMIFPNTRVRFRRWDKIRFGVSAGGGVGMGVFGTVSKIALMSNPTTALGAIAAFGGVLFRQVSSFVAQRNRYMVVMAQNLYFHSMADNRGVMTLLASRAAEEDVKEEILLYSALAAQGPIPADNIDRIDATIEKYLKDTFELDVDFDVRDALSRLKADGIVTETADGMLTTLPPQQAAQQIDMLWDRCLDDLPDAFPDEGMEIDVSHHAAATA
jgi:hypothetical protein